MAKKRAARKFFKTHWLLWLVIIFGLGFVIGIIVNNNFNLSFNQKTKKQSLNIKKTSNQKSVVDKPRSLVRLAKTTILKTLKIPIIMYHYVEYVQDKNDTIRRSLSITPYTFEQQLAALHDAKYTTYFVKEIPNLFKGELNYSTKSAVLTFDDGYRDFYTDVFPLLKKYQVKATIFLIYNFLDTPNFLTKVQVNEMINSGLVEIGAHTLNHVYLKGMLFEQAKTEIIESKKKLEEDFAISVKSFAYPFGAYDDQAVFLVKQAGFIAAVTTDTGAIQKKDDFFRLVRIRSGVVATPDIISILENYNR